MNECRQEAGTIGNVASGLWLGDSALYGVPWMRNSVRVLRLLNLSGSGSLTGRVTPQRAQRE